MNNTTKRIIQFVIAAAAYFGVSYGYRMYIEHEALARADEKMNQLKVDAVKQHPELSASEAIKQESIALSEERIKSASNDTQRRLRAAGSFYGFYLMNARSRVEFCNERGINIQPFVEAFKRNNSTELEKSRSIISHTDGNEDSIYLMMKSRIRSAIDDDMAELATTNKTDAKGACKLVADGAITFADALHFSKIQPAVDQVLMSAP